MNKSGWFLALAFLGLLFYFYTNFNSNQTNSLVAKCGEDGAAFAEKFKSEYYQPDTSIWGNPEFHYNHKLKTCLVDTSLTIGAFNMDLNFIWYFSQVTDIYSGKVIVYSRYTIRKGLSGLVNPVNLITVGDAQNLSQGDFNSIKNKLFSE